MSGFPYAAGLILITLLTGCSGVPTQSPGGSDPNAVHLLRQSASAHGEEALVSINDVSVHYSGHWLSFVSSIQSNLADPRFRGTSEERYMVSQQAVGQSHYGPGGEKHVFRKPGVVRVWYNAKETDEPDTLAAAALVADAYRMFLFGPHFFLERGATVQTLGEEDIDGMTCDNLLAILTPGIGVSAEDRVIVSIDREKHLIRRLRMTVDGLSSTRGAVADIYLRDYLQHGGVQWPTSFYEELRKPFAAPVHQWKMTGIDLNRGQTADLFDVDEFIGVADAPAGSPNAR